MRKNFAFYIVDENGQMRNTQNHHCTEEERAAHFNKFKEGVKEEYPGSFAAWQEGRDSEYLEEELRRAKENIEYMEREQMD